ncbi:MAG TPA: hypothetical protein VJK54_00470, partial [Chthoniobacterales bacterium]|nr:hypothetical protein [Chthoniobacterales bacterium]
NGIEYKDVDNQSSLLANNSVPISNLPSSISYLGVAPKLMMNPAIEAGTKAIEEALGIFGKNSSSTERAITKTRLPVGSSSSSASSAAMPKKAVEATEAEGEFLEDNSIALEKANQEKGSESDLMTMEGGYLFPSVGGGIYNGRWYTSHALERMAPETPEIMKILVSRAIKRAQSAGFTFDVDSFQSCAHQPDALSIWWKVYCPRDKGMPVPPFKLWWYTYGPQPRGVLPSEVEAEIAHPGTTGLMVITSEEGDVKTVIRKKVLLPSNSTETGLSVENSSSSATMEGEGNLASVEAIEAALTAEESEEDDVNAFLEKEEEGGKTETIEELEGKMQETDIKGDSKAANDQHHCSKRNAKDRAMEQMGQMTRNCQKARAALAQGMSERVVLWRKAAEQSLTSANKWKQVVQACVSGNEETVKAMLSRAYLADFLSDAATIIATSSEKAEEAFAEGNQDLAMLWNKVATKYQESVEYYREVASDLSNVNDTDYDRFFQADQSVESSSKHLEEAMTALEKVVQAKEENQEELAVLWFKIANKHQEAAECHCHAAHAAISQNSNDYDRFDQEAVCARESVQRLEKASKAANAVISQNLPDDKRLQKAAISEKKSANKLEKQKEKLKQKEKKNEAKKNDHKASLLDRATVPTSVAIRLPVGSNSSSSSSATISEQGAVEAVSTILTAEESEEEKVGTFLEEYEEDEQSEDLEELEGQVKALNVKEDAKTAHTQHNWSKSNARDRVTAQTEQAVRSRQKESEALAQGMSERAILWRKAAEQSEASAEEWKRVLQACVSENEETVKAMTSRAYSDFCLSHAATSIAKSEEARAQGDHEQAVLWRNIATQYEESAEYRRQAANALSSGNNADYDRLDTAGKYAKTGALQLENVSHALEKAVEAATADGGGLAALWRKTAEQYKEFAEYHRQDASDYSHGNVDKRKHRSFWAAYHAIKGVVKQLEEASSALGKAAQARAANQIELATIWFTVAEKFQESVEYKYQATNVRSNAADRKRFNKLGKSAMISAYRLKNSITAEEQATQAGVAAVAPSAKALKKANRKKFTTKITKEEN